MLRGTDAEIKRINEVFKMFLEFTNEHLMSFLHENSQETQDKSDNLLGMVSQFIKEYSQVLLVQYGLYIEEIAEASDKEEVQKYNDDPSQNKRLLDAQ